MDFTIERLSLNVLELEIWKFVSHDNIIRLTGYSLQKRLKLTSPFKIEKVYTKVNYRGYKYLKISEVPLPEDVMEEVKKEFISKIFVVKE